VSRLLSIPCALIGTFLSASSALQTGCAPAENAAAGARSLVNHVSDRTTDASVTFAVRAALIDADTVRSRDIQVETTHGVVTLKGTQPSAAARVQAEHVARSTEGVSAVVNKITVSGKPSPPRAQPPASHRPPAVPAPPPAPPAPVAPAPGEV
jgi:hypothetical protein